MPAAELGRRFGPKLLDYLDRLSGQRPDPRICITPAASFTAELNFLQSISNKEALAFPMQRLAQDLSNWLIGRQLGVLRINGTSRRSIREQRDGNRIRAAPTNKQALLSISRLKLDVLDLPDEVLSLRLSSIRLAPWHAETVSCSHEQNMPGHSPTDLIDQFKARLGMVSVPGSPPATSTAPSQPGSR